MNLGDEGARVKSYERSDILGYGEEYPFYVKSGDGIDSKCGGQYLNLVGQVPGCSATLAQYAGSQNGNMSTFFAQNQSSIKWQQALPGCANGTGAFAWQADCGDDEFIVRQNVSNYFPLGEIFPTIQTRFVNDIVYFCGPAQQQLNLPLLGGMSKADYTITISHWKRDPIFAGTSLWLSAYEHESISFEGTSSYNSSTPFTGVDSSGALVTSDLYCQSQVVVNHELEFWDIETTKDMIEEYLEDPSNSWGIYVDIEIKNLRTENGLSYDAVQWITPFMGNNDTAVMMELDFVMYEADPFNSFLRLGVLVMGVGFWAVALASTPYWDPFIKRLKE